MRDDPPGAALTVWSDKIDNKVDPWVVDIRNERRLAEWRGKPGNTARKAHIRFGLETCGGWFDLILCRAVDPQVEPRKVEAVRHWKERVGLILPEDCDDDTGGYRMTLRPATERPAD